MGLLPTSTPKQSTTNNNNAKSRSSQHPSIASASGNQKSNRLYTKAVHPNLTPSKPRNNGKGVTDSLAICLFGYSSHRMYDSEYEEEVRKQAVMQEVLPDATMWKKWEATEAPLRQGRGWYPTLDRHFLELLVISEIHCLSHPLQGYANPVPSPNAERIHRHASRVRRVACERIGAERLHAYCDRVKEAFEAYMQGGWGGSVGAGYVKSDVSDEEGEMASADDLALDEEERGRVMERGDGSLARRRDMGPSPPPTHNGDEAGDVSMVVDVSPLGSPSPSLTDSDSAEDTDTSFDEGEKDLLKIDLEGVIEVEEDEADSDEGKLSAALGKGKDDMDVDIVLGAKQIPQIHIVTPGQA